LREAHFAHDGAILQLGYLGDGKIACDERGCRTVKRGVGGFFQAATGVPLQPDWPSRWRFSGRRIRRSRWGFWRIAGFLLRAETGRRFRRQADGRDGQAGGECFCCGDEPMRGVQRIQRCASIDRPGTRDNHSHQDECAQVSVKMLPMEWLSPPMAELIAAEDARGAIRSFFPSTGKNA